MKQVPITDAQRQQIEVEIEEASKIYDAISEVYGKAVDIYIGLPEDHKANVSLSEAVTHLQAASWEAEQRRMTLETILYPNLYYDADDHGHSHGHNYGSDTDEGDKPDYDDHDVDAGDNYS